MFQKHRGKFGFHARASFCRIVRLCFQQPDEMTQLAQRKAELLHPLNQLHGALSAG
jgi:hypothetical protein